MVELALYLAVIMAYGLVCLLWEVAKLLWQFLLWAAPLLWRFWLWLTEPIRTELAHQRMIQEEREKEQRLLEAHQEALREIDAAVAQCDRMHAAALAQAGRQPDHGGPGRGLGTYNVGSPDSAAKRPRR